LTRDKSSFSQESDITAGGVSSARLDDRSGMRALVSKLRTIRSRWHTENSGAKSPGVAEPELEFDSGLDCDWAATDSRFERVLHVFHRPWRGIRAAAGYLPGHKLAIAADGSISEPALRNAAELIGANRIEAAVLHGFSVNAELLFRTLRSLLSPRSLRLYAVWHGNTAQLSVDAEATALQRVLKLRRKGILRGIGCVKGNLHQLSSLFFQKTLLNLPPKVAATTRSPNLDQLSAFIPIPNDWRKNFYTNLYAAANSPEIRRIDVTSQFRSISEFEHNKRIVIHPNLNRSRFIEIVREAGVVLGVTLSECQPMVQLEAAALGTPCLTGVLGLDELEGDPYMKLAQVTPSDSSAAIQRKMRAVFSIQRDHPSELAEMIEGFCTYFRREAASRYAEFLEL